MTSYAISPARPSLAIAPVVEYIERYWHVLVRHNPHDQGTRIGLPHPYLVPSDSVMFQEQYYWDSYFMALGLIDTPHEDLIFAMTENLAYLYERFGVIPNASRYYFLSRSQPPMLTSLIRLGYERLVQRGDAGATAYLARMMAVAEAEHETVWLGTAQPHERLVHAGLSRYFDINYLDHLAACESGWDHTARCSDRWLDHLPVDLNAILYVRELDFAYAATILGAPERAAVWQARAAERAATIQCLMWDDVRGFFYDYDWRREQRNPYTSLAGFFPLWAGLATPQQVARIVHEWLPRFERQGGLVTTLRAKAGRQWAYPNGWAPLQWLVVAGLERYGYTAEAQRIMLKWVTNCAEVFAATGTMWEKYNVIRIGGQIEEGLYGSIAGFGWSNAIFVDFARRLG
jgi:alpha,alpha-trehalase